MFSNVDMLQITIIAFYAALGFWIVRSIVHGFSMVLLKICAKNVVNKHKKTSSKYASFSL